MSNYLDLVKRRGRTAASDECYTPETSVAPLLKLIDTSKTYYEATSGKSSQMLTGFQKLGLDIRPSDGKDFLDCGPDDVYDGIITNPPYSKKDQFLEHCYNLGKPFALLLPVSAIQGQARGRWFIQYGLKLLVYNKRIDFTGGGSPHFGVAWFMGNGMVDARTYGQDKLWFTDYGETKDWGVYS